MFNQIQLREHASYSYVSKQIPWEKKIGKCYKTIGSYVSCAFIKIWSTWKVWRAFKKLELLLAMPQATLTYLSCSQTSRMLQILMNACWHMNQLLIIIKLAWDHFNLKMLFSTLWTHHQYAYSPYCSLYISKGADKENFSNNQDLF